MSEGELFESLAARLEAVLDELGAIALAAAPHCDRVDGVLLETMADYVREVMWETGFGRVAITDFGEEHRDLVPVADDSAAYRWGEELTT